MTKQETTREKRDKKEYHDPANHGVPLTELIERCGFVSKMTFHRAYNRNFKLRSF